MIFVDSNIFLRLLLQDIQDQSEEAKQFFLQASRKGIPLITSNLVFFEVAWVLRSSYGRNKRSLITTLIKMLDLKIEIEQRDLILEAIALYQSVNLSLEDCYNIIFAKQKQIKEFKTFDKKLLKTFNNIK